LTHRFRILDSAGPMEKIFKDPDGNLHSPPEILYQFYPSDARKFITSCLKEILDKPPPRFRELPIPLQRKAKGLLILELVAKFCETAEDLAAFAVAFATELYMEALSPEDVWKRLADYEPGDVVHFYRDIRKRHPKYFVNLHGFPPLDLQKDANRLEMLRSSKQLAAYLGQVSDMYMDLRELYNSYKHGMRVFVVTDTDLRTGRKVPALSYVDRTGKLKAIAFPSEGVEELYTWCIRLGNMLETILGWHKVRLDVNEKRMVTAGLHVFGGSGGSSKELRNLFYPGLFGARDAQVTEAERIVKRKTAELLGIPRGHVFAVDIDSEEILPYHGPELRDVIWQVLKARLGARVVFRRMTPDGKVGPY